MAVISRAKKEWPADKVEREEWRAIPGHDGYEAFTYGSVRSMPRVLSDGRKWRGGQLKTRINRHGYEVVALPIGDGRYRYVGVAVLVLETFVSLRPSPSMEAAHWDGDKLNNALSNLRWATAKENAADRDRHGRTARPKGEAHGLARLNDDAVRQIRAMKKSGVSVTELAVKFGMSRWALFDLLSGRTWSHVK